MQKNRTLLFPALTLCFLLVLGGFFLGRRSVGGVLLTTQHPAPAAAENQSQALTETHDRALSPPRKPLPLASTHRAVWSSTGPRWMS